MSAQCYSQNLGSFALTGGWKPPSNQTLSAALGLAITACITIRLGLEAPRNGDFVGAIGAARLMVRAAIHLFSVVAR